LILTIALNPSIDKTAVVDGLDINKKNIIEDYRLTLGDSSIYSAYIIKMLQGEPNVLGFAGGIGGRYIKNFLDKNRIKSDFIWKDTESKSFFRIIDSVNSTKTLLIDNTISYNEQDYKLFKYKLKNSIKDSKAIIIDGQTEYNETLNMIETTMKIAKDNIKKVVVSLEGLELRKSIEYSPYAIVIDNSTLMDLNISSLNINEILKELHTLLINNSIHYIILNYKDNVYAISKNKICKGEYTFNVEKSDMTGIKDSIVGGIAIASERKYEIEKMVKLAMGIKAALKVDCHPIICTRKEIDKNINKVKIIEVYNKQKGFIEN
jgi:fructose-1-phosphate kinase PfkB-like protein